MPINYIANDPDAQGSIGSALDVIEPSRDRASGASGFTVSKLSVEGKYGPDTREFVGWQAREAALRAVAAFEEACGPLPGWRGQEANRLLDLLPVAGQELNAYYDRVSISFFVATVKGKPVYSGASTDVVAHETGHAILDAIRPELFGVNMMEVGAFHEGFGDCVAILAALADRKQADAVIKLGLRQPNFVESFAEQLAAAIRTMVPGHNAGAPRHALNSFQWSFPASLPIDGKPGTLINEEHSLGQLAAGVFYDLVCNLYDAGGQGDGEALWVAAKTAMKLCARGAEAAPVKPRFFESWGRTIMLIDAEEENGRHADAIRAAFDAHGIAVGAANFLSPRARLTKSKRRSPKRENITATPKTKSFVRSALGLALKAPLQSRALSIGTHQLVELVGSRDVDLTGVAERLANVFASVPQPALVGEMDSAPVLLGAVDTAFTYDAEVREFAASLVARGAIAFDRTGQSHRGAGVVALENQPTHRIVDEKGQRVLKRIVFACGCGHRNASCGRRNVPATQKVSGRV